MAWATISGEWRDAVGAAHGAESKYKRLVKAIAQDIERGEVQGKVGSTWKVTGRMDINMSPGPPTVSPVESAGGFTPF